MTIDAVEPPGTAAAVRRWPLWLGLAVLAAIAWRVLSLGQADALANKDPDTALAWRADHSNALRAKAQSRLVAGDATGAEQLAKRALAANPLDGMAYRLLADVSLARGQSDEALGRFELAAQRAPRDLPSRAWLANHYLHAGDYSRALIHLDAMLRVEPELSRQIFPDLIKLATVPAAQVPITRILISRPPWRSDFVVQLSQSVPNVLSVAPLMERLRHGPGGFADAEVTAWLDRLVSDRQWGAAYLTWIAQLPKEKQRAIGNVFNGGFDWQPSNNGFGWRFGRVPGARIDRAETNGATNDFALRVAFDDQRVPFSHVRELLALSPGTYRLDGRARLDSLRTELGLVWEVTCAESGRELTRSAPFLGNSPWRSFSVEFVVPDGDCGGQWLQLRLPARIPAEQRIGGVAWFDDLKITRRPGP